MRFMAAGLAREFSLLPLAFFWGGCAELKSEGPRRARGRRFQAHREAGPTHTHAWRGRGPHPTGEETAGNTGGRATRGFALSAHDFKEIENVQDETVEKTAARPCSPQSHPEPFPPGLHRQVSPEVRNSQTRHGGKSSYSVRTGS